jgi:hypothetical protein
MLLDESEQADTGHPISLARDYGDLDDDPNLPCQLFDQHQNNSTHWAGRQLKLKARDYPTLVFAWQSSPTDLSTGGAVHLNFPSVDRAGGSSRAKLHSIL